MVAHVIDFSEASKGSKLNPLGRNLRQYIWDEVASAQNNVEVTSIVLYGGDSHKNFSAGADLTEFASAESILPSSSSSSTKQLLSLQKTSGTPSLIDVVDAIEASTKPVVAAIQGACLGGGLEVALACHYRVSDAKKTKLGLPEVHVGVIPGAGGTQRLPRLVGIKHALNLILTGQTISGMEALKIHLIDECCSKDMNVLDRAIQWALWAEVLPNFDDRRLSQRRVPDPPAQAHAMCHVASLSIPKLGTEGIHAALEAIRASYAAPSFAQGMETEGRLFLQVLQSSQGKARRHAFFAVRQAQKLLHPSSGKQQPHVLVSSPKQRQDVQVGVIGAGTMGGGIALVLLQAGFRVHLVDVSKRSLEQGVRRLQGIVKSNVQRRKMPEKQAQLLLSRLTATQDLNDLATCKLIVEAVVEKMKVKQDIFRTLNTTTKPDCILLSNTSTLSIDDMASILDPPRRQFFAGWHFFSPAHVMKLVEIVVGQDTSSTTVSLLQLLTKQLGKIGVVVGNCDGFCGNRLLRPYSAETTLLLVEENCSIEQVDQALVNFGMALGPFQLGDLAGNDVGYNIRKERGWVREKGTGCSSGVPVKRPARYTELADDMVSKLGRLGQKVGKGWYDYDPAIGKGRKALPSPEMQDFVRRYVQPGAHGRPLTEEDIIERVLYPLVNEGFKCLEEGIAQSPSDIDVVYLYGYGWPMWRGGPMYWADHDVQLPNLLAKLEEFHCRFPDTDHYVPSQLLVDCVRSGLSVEEYSRRGLLTKRSSRL